MRANRVLQRRRLNMDDLLDMLQFPVPLGPAKENAGTVAFCCEAYLRIQEGNAGSQKTKSSEGPGSKPWAVGDDGIVGDWRIRPTIDRALFRIKHSDREPLQLLER